MTRGWQRNRHADAGRHPRLPCRDQQRRGWRASARHDNHHNRRANDFGGWYDLRDFQDDVGIFSGVGIELPTPGLARVGGGSGTLAAATALPWTLVSLWPSPRAGPRNYPRPAAAARPKAVQHRLTGDLPSPRAPTLDQRARRIRGDARTLDARAMPKSLIIGCVPYGIRTRVTNVKETLRRPHASTSATLTH
jgi:hypothetical protein